MCCSVLKSICLTPSTLFFVSGGVRGVVNVCGSTVCVEIWTRGGVCEYSGYCARRQCHFVWEGVFMVAGAVVHWVCAAPPQPGQEQRIPTILQTDAGTEAPAAHCTLCRYNCANVVRELKICLLHMCGSVFSTRWQ